MTRVTKKAGPPKKPAKAAAKKRAIAMRDSDLAPGSVVPTRHDPAEDGPKCPDDGRWHVVERRGLFYVESAPQTRPVVYWRLFYVESAPKTRPGVYWQLGSVGRTARGRIGAVVTAFTQRDKADAFCAIANLRHTP